MTLAASLIASVSGQESSNPDKERKKSDSAADEASDLFGLTKVCTVHLKVTAENWEKMQPPRGTGPGGPGRGPGEPRDRFRGPDQPAGREPRPERDGAAPFPGIRPMRPGPGGLVGPRLLSEADASRDGKLSQAELEQHFENWFTKWDKDGNARMDIGELKEGLSAAFPLPGPPPFGPPGEPPPMGADLGPGAPPPPQGAGRAPQPGNPPQRRMMGMPQTDYPDISADFEFNGRSFTNVALRFKGNSSFWTSEGEIKRPFKIDFNDYVKGQKFFGMTKLNLSNNAMDPTLMREAIAYEVFRQAGIPAARTAFAKLYLTVPGKFDRQYLGVYTLIEQVDERFLKNHFDTKKGLLLKPETSPDLPYLGDDWNAYKGERPYDPQTDGSAAERRRFTGFLKLLAEADDPTFRKEIGEHMDMEQFLRFLAVNAALVNLDSFLAMGHNFYLYVHPETLKVMWIPWDLNHAFGGFRAGPPVQGEAAANRGQTDLSIRHPHIGRNKLIERLLAVPQYKATYEREMQKLIDGPFKPEDVLAKIDAVEKAIRPAIEGDPVLGIAQFENALFRDADSRLPEPLPPRAAGSGPRRGPRMTGPPGMRGGPPLKSWVPMRVASIRDQLAGKSDGVVNERGRFGRLPDAAERRGPQPGIRGFGDIHGADILRAADTSKDESISKAEFRALAASWFKQWDADGKGALDDARIMDGLDDVLPPPGF